jgi:uncharacterized membrane protein
MIWFALGMLLYLVATTALAVVIGRSIRIADEAECPRRRP